MFTDTEPVRETRNVWLDREGDQWLYADGGWNYRSPPNKGDGLRHGPFRWQSAQPFLPFYIDQRGLR